MRKGFLAWIKESEDENVKSNPAFYFNHYTVDFGGSALIRTKRSHEADESYGNTSYTRSCFIHSSYIPLCTTLFCSLNIMGDCGCQTLCADLLA